MNIISLIVSVIGTIASIIGIYLSVYFFRKGKAKKRDKAVRETELAIGLNKTKKTTKKWMLFGGVGLIGISGLIILIGYNLYNGDVISTVGSNGKYGYVKDNFFSTKVTPFKYDIAYPFKEDGFAPVSLSGKWGFIDTKGNEVVSLIYDLYIEDKSHSTVFVEGLVPVKKDDKWGFIDQKGNETIPFKYQSAFSFQEGFAIVELNGELRQIDKEGKTQYEYIGILKDNITIVGLKGKYGYVDSDYNELTLIKYDRAYSFQEDLAVVILDGKYGYINRKGKEVIPCKYDYAFNFKNGEACVKIFDKYIYFDKQGKRVK